MTTGTTAVAVTPTVRQTASRLRFAGIVALVIALIVLIPLVAGSRGLAATGFDPENAGEDGARALAEVLRQQGVDVREVDRLRDARDLGAGTTLLVDDSSALLSRAQWARLLRSSGHLVVVQPDVAALEATLPGAHVAGDPAADLVDAGCDSRLGRLAQRMSIAAAASSLRLQQGGTLCFRDGSGRGQIAEGVHDGVPVTLLASREPFTNEHIAESGNASVALNALGTERRLIWLHPSPLDSPAGVTPSLASLTPPWVFPLSVLVLLAGVAAAFWRGRRLGPLVVERLPVTVRSRETVDGRARLYQRGASRLRAADALRIGAVGRLAPLLGLGRSAPVDAVVRAAAERSGWPAAMVQAILVDEVPHSDGALVTLSDRLTQLERAVAAAMAGIRPPSPPGAP